MSKISDALLASRYKGHKSQEYVSEMLDVSRKTIQNWERGTSEPTVSQVFKWFRALGVNPVPFLFDFAYPKDFRDLGGRSESDVDKAFEDLSESLSIDDKLAILFLYTGEHGSSPSSIIQLVLAHLHNPLRDRIPIASSVLTSYKINKDTNRVICEGFPLPDVERLERSIRCAIESVTNNAEGYSMTE